MSAPFDLDAMRAAARNSARQLRTGDGYSSAVQIMVTDAGISETPFFLGQGDYPTGKNIADTVTRYGNAGADAIEALLAEIERLTAELAEARAKAFEEAAKALEDQRDGARALAALAKRHRHKDDERAHSNDANAITLCIMAIRALKEPKP